MYFNVKLTLWGIEKCLKIWETDKVHQKNFEILKIKLIPQIFMYLSLKLMNN